MFVSKNFVYTELHKTAGSHIGKWLNILVPGEQIGKHNVIPVDLRNRKILGSIRNPWDWYVSLWAYGCDKKGSVWFQATDKINFQYYREQLPREMGEKYISPRVILMQLLYDINKPISVWEQVYSDASDPENFKAWLKLIFNTERKFDIREGYGFSPISENSGILTYRFFKLFSNLGAKLFSKDLFDHDSNLRNLWSKHCIADYFIRMENLEDDLIEAMRLSSISISEKSKDQLLTSKNNKTNTSSRSDTDYYYDEESIQIISSREGFIIDLFNYEPPKI